MDCSHCNPTITVCSLVLFNSLVLFIRKGENWSGKGLPSDTGNSSDPDENAGSLHKQDSAEQNRTYNPCKIPEGYWFQYN
jgi:hypothetical protein